MKKGISFFFGRDYNFRERAKDIAAAGFDCVMATADPIFDDQNGTISQQMRAFEKNNLQVSSLHMRYIASDLPHFFMDDEIGDKLEKNLIKDLNVAKKYGFKCVVVHMKGDLSEVGIKRFERILEVCKKVQVPLALENINFNYELLKYFFDNYDKDYVKFCYDSGHNHCFDPERDFLKEFGDRLACLHLHDNMGENDDHTLNDFGNIDWAKVARGLAACPEVSLDYELLLKKPCDLRKDEVLKKCFAQAVELENMIEKERAKR